MIAILEDNKGFRKEIYYPKHDPQINIPLLSKLNVHFQGLDVSSMPRDAKLNFLHHKCLGEDICIYKQVD